MLKSRLTYYSLILTVFICFSCEQSIDNAVDLPNVLWITTEDITPMLGTYGNPVATTPTLDDLASRGLQFNNAYSTAPVCAPARSCLVTGVYATSLGTQNLRSEFSIPEKIRTLPHLLREKGYYCSNNYKEDYNFTDTTIWDESSHEAHWRKRPPGTPFFSVFNFETTHQSQIFGNDSVFYEKYGRLLTEEERQDPDEIQLPPYYFDSPLVRKLWARYYDLVTLMDRQVADILEQLEQDGLTDNTIVFFFSDHGTGMPRAKRALYNSGTQVPFIVYIPEKYRNITEYQPGSEIEDIVSFVDFPPTVLSLAGIEVPDYMMGNSFLGEDKSSPRQYAYATSDRVDEAFEISRTVKTENISYIRNFLPHMPLIQPNFYTDQSEIMKELYRLKPEIDMTPAQKSMWLPKREPEELYDLNLDPYETDNLAGNPEYRDKLIEMRNKMRSWMLDTRDTGLMPEAYMIKNTGQGTAFDLARDMNLYPIENLLDLNNYILDGVVDEARLADHLVGQPELIRYWSAVWLQYSEKLEEATVRLLQNTLDDESTMVKLAAAETLCASGNCINEAQDVILEGLQSNEDVLVLMAARIFELNKERADNIEDEVKSIKNDLEQSTSGKWKGYDLYAFWALREAFKE